MTEFKLTKGQATTLSILKDFMDDKDPKAKYMVVQGDSGTGKSTLIKEMCQQIPGDVLVTATTNKAAEVISTMLGKAKSTIHSALSLTIKNDHKTGKEELTLKEEPVHVIMLSLLMKPVLSVMSSLSISMKLRSIVRLSWLGISFNLLR